MKYDIRRIEPEKTNGLHRILHAAKADPVLQSRKGPQGQRALSRMDEVRLEREAGMKMGVHAAYIDDRPVGIAIYPSRGECLLYVDPEHREKGIGSALFQAVQNRAEELGDLVPHANEAFNYRIPEGVRQRSGAW